MSKHDSYTADFFRIFETLEYWGPGSENDTRRALSLVPNSPADILEVGCGKGLATKVLAESSQANIIALDNEQSALDRLAQRFEQLGFSDRIETLNASMAELPFEKQRFDVIWAEGSAYVIGVENALLQWKPLLRAQGCLVISDMVWRTDAPGEQATGFWSQEYPDMQSVTTRIEQIVAAGYRVVGHFPMSDQAWSNYYVPLQARVAKLETELFASAALADVKREVDICTRFAHEFGYYMFVLA